MLIPYLIWTLFYTLISNVNNLSLLGTELVENVITGNAASPLYYILLLLQLEVLLPLLLKLRKNKWTKSALWLITPMYLLFIYLFHFKTGEHPSNYATWFPSYIGFYLLGIEIKESGGKVCKGYKTIVITMGALILSVVEGLFLASAGYPMFAVSQIKVTSFIYTLSLVSLIVYGDTLYLGVQSGIERFLCHIGDDSYAIFYVHCFWLRILDVLTRGKAWTNQIPWLFRTLFLASAVLTLCEMTIIVARKVAATFNMSKMLRYIGF